MIDDKTTMTMTIEMTPRQELISMYSDMHKDAYGFRPRGVNYDKFTDAELEAKLDSFEKVIETNIAEEKAWEILKIAEHKAMLNRYITEYGAENETQALKWYIDAEGPFDDFQDVDQLLWRAGILHSEYGRILGEKIVAIVSESNN